MKSLNEKKGEMTLTTIIVIILGILVLVFLIFGFSNAWANLWDRIVNFGGGGSNFNTISSACKVSCSANEKEEWCSRERVVKYGKKLDVPAWNGSALVTGLKQSSGSCDFINKNPNYFPGLTIDDCPSIKCE